MKKRATKNPGRKHLPGATPKEQRQYEHILKSELDRGASLRDAKRIAAATVRGQERKTRGRKKRNPSYTVEAIPKYTSKVKETVSALTSGSAVRKVKKKVQGPKNIYRYRVEKNPIRKRIKNEGRYVDLVIKGQAKQTAEGWKVGGKTYPWGRGTTKISTRLFLDRNTGIVYAKKERANPTRKRRNPTRKGMRRYYGAARKTARGIAKAHGFEKGKAAEKIIRKHYRGAKSSGARYKRVRGENPTRRGMRKGYASARRRSAKYPTLRSERDLRKSARRVVSARKRNNPSAAEIRREFSGAVTGERVLHFPMGTPQGELAKLGKLVSITTEEGVIKPVAGVAWLASDTRGKLHIGSTSGAPLYDGPKRDFGEVTKIEYEDVKRHLNYSKPTIFFHHVGERNGIRPHLCADGQGGLVFKGGDYVITSRGLEN